jgi:hypothetical protein
MSFGTHPPLPSPDTHTGGTIMNSTNDADPQTTSNQRANQETQQLQTSNPPAPLTTLDQRADPEGQRFGEAGMERSLERGESMTDDAGPTDASSEELDPMDSHLLSHAEGVDEMDGADTADETSDSHMNRSESETTRSDGQAGEDEENPNGHTYGEGRMSHGVDLDAPADSGSFGDPNDNRPDERLAGNER